VRRDLEVKIGRGVKLRQWRQLLTDKGSKSLERREKRVLEAVLTVA
jgi:hypothetical protein